MTTRKSSVLFTALLLFASAIASGQSITLTGYVTKIDAPHGETSFCGCAVNDSVSAVIELRTYFSAPAGMHRPALSIYPLTTAPPEAGLPELAFAGNAFHLQIGDHFWVNQFVRKTGQSGELQFSRPLGGNQSSPTSTSLFSNGFWADRIDAGGNVIDSGGDIVRMDIDSRPSALWNTTGDPIPQFDVVAPDKAPILKGGSVLTLRNSKSFDTVVIAITKISAAPNRVSEVTSDAIKAAVAKADQEEAEKARSSPRPRALRNSTLQSSPFLPPTNLPPGASPQPQYVLSNSPLDPCKLSITSMTAVTAGIAGGATSGVARNLNSFYVFTEEAEAGVAVFRTEVSIWLLMLPPLEICTAEYLSSAMAAHKAGRSSRGGDGNSPSYKDTPGSAPEKFKRIGGSTPAWKNLDDGSVWEKDYGKHGGQSTGQQGSAWKRWPNVRSWESETDPQSIWPDGRVRK